MNNVFYSTTNGEQDGRASHFYRNQAQAQAKIDKQNLKAEEMGIKARYQMATAIESEVADKKSIR